MFGFKNTKYKTNIIFLILGIFLGVMLSQIYSVAVQSGYHTIYKYISPVGYQLNQTRQLEEKLTKGKKIPTEKILKQVGKNMSIFFKKQEIDKNLFKQTKSLLDQAIHGKDGRNLCLLYSSRFDLHKRRYNLTVGESSSKQKDYLNRLLHQIIFLTKKIQEDCPQDARLKARIILFLNEEFELNHLSQKFKGDFLAEVDKAIKKEVENFGETPIVEELRKAKKIIKRDYSS